MILFKRFNWPRLGPSGSVIFSRALAMNLLRVPRSKCTSASPRLHAVHPFMFRTFFFVLTSVSAMNRVEPEWLRNGNGYAGKATWLEPGIDGMKGSPSPSADAAAPWRGNRGH